MIQPFYNVSNQLSSFILNRQIPDSDIPLAFFGLRSVDKIYPQPDDCYLDKLPDELLEFIAKKMNFSAFVNFSATHTRNVSCLRSDRVIKQIFDNDRSMQELLCLRDLLKRAQDFGLKICKYRERSYITKCPIRVFAEGPGQLKFDLTKEFNDPSIRQDSNSHKHNIFNFFVCNFYGFAKDESVQPGHRAFCCDCIVKINNEYDSEGYALGVDRAEMFLAFAKKLGGYDDKGENRTKLTNLFEFIMKKPSDTELDIFISESMS